MLGGRRVGESSVQVLPSVSPEDIGTINRLEGRLPQIAISEVEVGLRSTSQIGGPSDLR